MGLVSFPVVYLQHPVQGRFSNTYPWWAVRDFVLHPYWKTLSGVKTELVENYLVTSLYRSEAIYITLISKITKLWLLSVFCSPIWSHLNNVLDFLLPPEGQKFYKHILIAMKNNKFLLMFYKANINKSYLFSLFLNFILLLDNLIYVCNVFGYFFIPCFFLQSLLLSTTHPVLLNNLPLP